ncbi:MAG: hypothetical protein LBI03_04775, partial [Clostridiales bacterium]|nr:hypothetical protein [Clostridiales bacterium]
AAIWSLINGKDLDKETDTKDYSKDIRLYEQVADPKSNLKNLKEQIINAAIALKLAMNLYDLGKGDVNNAGQSGSEPLQNES